MSLENVLEKTSDKSQYVTTKDFGNLKRYILGNIENDSWTTTLRLNYSLNPNMSIQFYGQPYIARGRYSDFNYVTNSTASSINDRVRMYNENEISENNDHFSIDENLDAIADYTFKNPDFSYVQFRTNLVARWEYIPGSELFFVWARGGAGSDDARNSLSRSFRNQILDKPLESTFLIKATYRFVR